MVAPALGRRGGEPGIGTDRRASSRVSAARKSASPVLVICHETELYFVEPVGFDKAPHGAVSAYGQKMRLFASWWGASVWRCAGGIRDVGQGPGDRCELSKACN
jgi:hypothetical protein